MTENVHEKDQSCADRLEHRKLARRASINERTNRHGSVDKGLLQLTSFAQEIESADGGARGVAADGDGREVERDGLIRRSVVLVNQNLTCGKK